MQETWVRSLGREDPLEKGMATHSSILAWRNPWTEEPGGLGRAGTPGHPVGIHWALPERSQKKHPGLEVLGELVINGQDLKRMVVVDPKFILCWG